MCAAALSVGVSAHSAPQSQQARAKSQAVDFARPDSTRPPQDLLLKPEDSRKADALASFSDGMLAEENADSERALESYRKVLDLDPGFIDLASKVAMEYVRRKSFDQAIGVLKDAMKASPACVPEVPLLIAEIYAKYLKKPEPAIRYANQALEMDPNNVLGYVTLFEAQLSNHQPKKAEQVLERAGKIKNEDPQFWLQLADIYSGAVLKEGQTPKPEDLEKVNAVYRKALSFDGDNLDLLLRVAGYYKQSRQYKEAIPLYEEIVKQLQANPDAMLAQIQEELARCYQLVGRTQDAIDCLKQVIKDNPLRYETYELLGALYEQQGAFENALANYRQLLLMNSGHPTNYLRVADMHLKLKQWPKAVEVLKEARAKFPEIPQVTYSLAIALTQAKQYQEALTTFSECLHDAQSGQPDMLNSAFYLAYGAAADEAGNLEQAEVLLKRSIEVDPDNSAEPCNHLGYMWIERGIHLEEAGKLIQKALELDPNNGAFLDSMGWLYFKKGDYPKALELLKQAAANITPEDPVVYEHLGDTWLNLGNNLEAVIDWQKALGLDPENKALKEKIDSLTAAPQAAASPVPSVSPLPSATPAPAPVKTVSQSK